MYLYPMMVTFDLKLKDLYRNSLLFAMLRLPFNFLFLIISILLMGVLPFVLFFTASGITIMIGLVYYVLVGFAFNLLMTVFFAYRGLDRFMIKRFAEQQEKPDDADAIEPTESDSSDSKPKE
jgi:membrane protein implicated in regulation of membrane protease activity